MHLHRFPEGLAFVPPFLEGHGAFVYDQVLAPTVRIRDLNRRVGGLQVSPGLRFAWGGHSSRRGRYTRKCPCSKLAAVLGVDARFVD
jgi:hypothetical protein